MGHSNALACCQLLGTVSWWLSAGPVSRMSSCTAAKWFPVDEGLLSRVQARVLGCTTLPQVLRALRQPIDGEPHPTPEQFLK